MCGFCGFLNYKFTVDGSVINKMVEVINHRGPDDIGVYEDKNETWFNYLLKQEMIDKGCYIN